MRETRLYAESALLSDGWANSVLMEFDSAGTIKRIERDIEAHDAPRAGGTVIPAMPNLHSHAFQRAMAGLAERAGPGDDSFWSWRQVMYGFLEKLTPEDLQAIAAQLYVEMLKAGYSSVAEFHYLHHAPDGRPYGDPAEMAMRILGASDETGIGLTLLPVLYGYGGFGGQAPGEAQKRFINGPKRYAGILETLHKTLSGQEDKKLGIAPHSLRAVSKETLNAAIEALDELDPSLPIHIHIAEQTKEVQDCIDWCGKRPVEWLGDEVELSERWCLVHATHVSEEEVAMLAQSGVVVGLCPTTEANLGDGLFPAVSYLRGGGRFGIGSDSHISVSPVEELRWLEYGQRLAQHGRNLLTGQKNVSVGASLYRDALRGGAQALGRNAASLQVGAKADLLVLDPESPLLTGREGDRLLDSFIFSGNSNPVKHVMVGARWLVRDGHHGDEEAIAERYRQCQLRLMDR